MAAPMLRSLRRVKHLSLSDGHSPARRRARLSMPAPSIRLQPEVLTTLVRWRTARLQRRVPAAKEHKSFCSQRRTAIDVSHVATVGYPITPRGPCGWRGASGLPMAFRFEEIRPMFRQTSTAVLAALVSLTVGGFTLATAQEPQAANAGGQKAAGSPAESLPKHTTKSIWHEADARPFGRVYDGQRRVETDTWLFLQ